MAVTVSPPQPYSPSTLSLDSPSRWPKLLPLLRPSLKQAQLPNGESILVDTTLATSSPVLHVAATTKAAEFSSIILDGRNATAVLSEPKDGGSLDIGEIRKAIASASGAGDDKAVVLVRAGKRRAVKNHESAGVEVEVSTAVERDHVLSLLGNAGKKAGNSSSQVEQLLKSFVDGSVLVQSRFGGEKKDGKPALNGASNAYGFDSARHVVEQEIEVAMGEVKKKGQREGAVYSVHFADVNGLSRLEDYIFAGEVARYFESKNLAFHLSHSSVIDHEDAARGFAISIVAVSQDQLVGQPSPKSHQSSAATTSSTAQQSPLKALKMTFTDAPIRARILKGCEAVISEEPKITEYDTVVGDGDCGYTLRDGAKLVQSFIADKDLSNLPAVVAALVADLEVSMGGTSGALYCIFLTALSTALATEDSIAKALKGALGVLEKFTNARVGDRTMMDALIPFVDTLAAGESAEAAVKKAKEGVRGTEKMEARLGRSAYLDDSATQGVPDPGAYGLGVLLEAMAKGG